jgi:hypothetical protein
MPPGFVGAPSSPTSALLVLLPSMEAAASAAQDVPASYVLLASVQASAQKGEMPLDWGQTALDRCAARLYYLSLC